MNIRVSIITTIIKSITVQSTQSSIYNIHKVRLNPISTYSQAYTCINTAILLHVLTLQYIYKNMLRNIELSKTMLKLGTSSPYCFTSPASHLHP
jgi:hypothetical protein